MQRVLGSLDCVVCGQQNPQGMRLRFAVGGGAAETSWTVAPAFQGFRGVLQGGMVLAILDDCMWYAVYGEGALTLTADASVRYSRPVPVGAEVVARARVVAHRGRLWQCEAELRPAAGGPVLASAGARFLTVPPGAREDLVAATSVHELPGECGA